MSFYHYFKPIGCCMCKHVAVFEGQDGDYYCEDHAREQYKNDNPPTRTDILDVQGDEQRKREQEDG